MVFVKDLFGLFNIQVVFGLFAPRQVDEPVEIGTHQGCLGRLRVHLFKPAQLLVRLALDLRRHLGLFDLLFDFVELFGALIAFAELLLNLF